MRVLIASSVHPVLDSRIVKQVESLVQAGHACTLWAPWSSTPKLQNCACAFFKPRRGILGRILTQLRFIQYATTKKWDVVHYHDFDMTVAAMLVVFFSSAKIVYDVHENYGEEVMVRGNINRFIRVPLRFLVNLIERCACRVLGHVVVVVPAQRRRFSRWGCRHIEIVRNYAHRALVPASTQDVRTTREATVVINIAGQSVDNGSLLTIDAARILKESSPDVSILTIDNFTPGLRDIYLGALEASAPNITLLPRIPPHELAQYLTRADIGLSVILDKPNKRIGIPTKLFEYMAFGLPIIATDVGYQADIIRESGAGMLIPTDPQALAHAICTLRANHELRLRYSTAGKKAFLERYCWESEQTRLLSFYDELSRQ